MSNSVTEKTFRPPSSKSITNRVVTLAGMSTRPVYIKDFLFAEDTVAGLLCLKSLGFGINVFEEDVFILPPKFKVLREQNFYSKPLEVNLQSAGTLARFFPAVVLNWNKTFPDENKITVSFTASQQLQKRPVISIINALKKLNGNISGAHYPFIISSSDLKGSVEIDTSTSSQFLSGLLIAAAGSGNNIEILRNGLLPQKDYVLITLDILKKFGFIFNYSEELHYFRLNIEESIKAKNLLNEKEVLEFSIEPDASTTCYYLATAFLKNISLTIEGLGSSSLQPDLLFTDFLIKLGAKIKLNENSIQIFKRESSKISGGFAYDFSLMSDQALTAGVLGLFADSPITITGVSHIRHHESNRIQSFVKNAEILGLNAQETEDGFIMNPQAENLQNISGEWKTYNDHRFAMSGFLLSSFNSNIKIENPECVQKTSPNFFKDIENLFNITTT